MNTTPESSSAILYIDDEEKALKYFRMAFAPKFPILTASSGEEGLALLRKEARKIGVVVSDQRMPGMIGAEVLGCVREEFPHVVRILTTAYSDLPTAIQAVNKGHIYQYVVKPWEVPELEMVLRRALDYHHILSERNELLRLKMGILQRILCCDRIKWLLLAFCGHSGTAACGFRQALFSLIRSFEDLPPPRTAGNVFRAEQFDATTLIQKELHTGVQLRAILVDETGAGAIPPKCEPVTKLGERGAALARELGAFLSVLPDNVAASVRITDGVVVTMSPCSPAFVEELTGVLFAGEPQPASILLLKLLWRFAEAGVPLTVVAEHPGNGMLRISPAPQPVSAEDVLAALRGVFERWDVASL